MQPSVQLAQCLVRRFLTRRQVPSAPRQIPSTPAATPHNVRQMPFFHRQREFRTPSRLSVTSCSSSHASAQAFSGALDLPRWRRSRFDQRSRATARRLPAYAGPGHGQVYSRHQKTPPHDRIHPHTAVSVPPVDAWRGCLNITYMMIGTPTAAGKTQKAHGGSSLHSGRFLPLST